MAESLVLKESKRQRQKKKKKKKRNDRHDHTYKHDLFLQLRVDNRAIQWLDEDDAEKMFSHQSTINYGP